MERRKAQLEHAKRAEAERLEEEAESRRRMLEYNLAEDVDPEQEDLCEAGAKPGMHTDLTPAPKSPEPRVIQSTEKATEEPQVPRELRGSGQDSMHDYAEASNEEQERAKANETHRFPGETSEEIETCKARAGIVTFTKSNEICMAWHGMAWCCSSESKMRMVYTGPISCTLEAPDRPAEKRKRCVA